MADALLPDADVIEHQVFRLGVRLGVGDFQFADGGGVILLVIADVAELGMEAGGEDRSGVAIEPAGVGIAGHGQVACGGGVVVLGTLLDGVAAEIVRFGQRGRITGAKDCVGGADGLVVLPGVEGMFAGVKLLARLGVAGASGQNKAENQKSEAQMTNQIRNPNNQ